MTASGSPALTVALPTCNGGRHLAETLRSILAQQGAAFDLVVSDDRSDDDTLDVVRAEAGDRARVVANAERLGLAGNWNRCVALSQTPLVAIFHQDDVMRPGHLAAHLAAFAQPDVGLVCGSADVIDAEGRPVPDSIVGRGDLGPADRYFPPGTFVRELAVGNPLRCSGVTIKVEAHAKVGGFDGSYRYAVDWDFWIQAARFWGVVWLARPTVAIRWHLASETHRFQTGTTDLDEQVRLLHWLHLVEGHRLSDAPALRKAADHRLAHAFLNRAHVLVRAGDGPQARSCLSQAVGFWPGIIGRVLRDPRLTVQMAALTVAPKAAGHWLKRSDVGA
ncbi:MAG: glycosyltransferase [Isosphaeraceae bacterium]